MAPPCQAGPGDRLGLPRGSPQPQLANESLRLDGPGSDSHVQVHMVGRLSSPSQGIEESPITAEDLITLRLILGTARTSSSHRAPTLMAASVCDASRQLPSSTSATSASVSITLPLESSCEAHKFPLQAMSLSQRGQLLYFHDAQAQIPTAD